MRRTWILLIILIAAIGLTLWFISRDRDEKASFELYEGDFAINDIDQVGRIFLTHRNGRTVDLKRRQGHWTINDQYRARPSSVNVLLDAIRTTQIKYIPPKAAVENIIRDLAVFGIKVEIFDRGNDLIKSYYVGGSTFDERGTHMIMEGAEQPFVVHMPSSEGSLRPRFTLSDMNWRDRHFLTSLDPEAIQTVAVAFPREKEQSFVLRQDRKGFNVTPYYENMPERNTPYKNGTGDAYLRAIKNAACESFEPQYVKKDSVRSLFPVAHFTIISDPADTLTMTFYPNGPINPSEFSEPYPRLFADCSNGDFMVVQYQVLEGLFRGYEFFFE